MSKGHCRQIIAFAFVLTVLGSLIRAAADSAVTLWSGQTGSYTLKWTSAELVAQSVQGQVLFSSKVIAEQGFGQYRKQMEGEGVGVCTYTREFQPVSFVADLLTLRDELETSCQSAAHPSFASRLTTIRLSESEKLSYKPNEEDDFKIDPKDAPGLVSLTNLFADTDILAALNKDPVLRANLGSPAESLNDLPESIGDSGMQVPGNPCKFRLAADYLYRFVLHHLVREQIGVRLQLTPVGGACSSQTAELGILLPVPTGFRNPLLKAADKTEGFLGISEPQRAKFATVSFTTNTGTH